MDMKGCEPSFVKANKRDLIGIRGVDMKGSDCMV